MLFHFSLRGRLMAMFASSLLLVSGLLVSSLLVTDAHAQRATGDGAVVISWPLAGNVLAGSSDTIYFKPGKINVIRWRVTIGASPQTMGVFDSGIQYLNSHPWELVIDGIPQNGKPVTLRFWQKGKGPWTYSDTCLLYTSDAADE